VLWALPAATHVVCLYITCIRNVALSDAMLSMYSILIAVSEPITYFCSLNYDNYFEISKLFFLHNVCYMLF